MWTYRRARVGRGTASALLASACRSNALVSALSLDASMNIGEILIWESSNLLLLIPVVIGLVMLVRWLKGRPENLRVQQHEA